MTRAARRHLSLFAFIATSAALVPQLGCQELLGIEPWASAGGGGAASSASGEVVASSESATAVATTDAASSTSGATCPIDCMGGECMGNTCLPDRVPLDNVEHGRIASLGDHVVVAQKVTSNATATLSRIAKASRHAANVYITTEPQIQAITTSFQGVVFWAGTKSLHRYDFMGADATLTSSTGENKTLDVDELALAKLGVGEEELCFTNEKSGVLCQPTVGQADPGVVLQLANAKGLAVDETSVFSVLDASTPSANIFSADGGSSKFVRIVPGAFAVLRHGAALYWLSTDNALHRVDLANAENGPDILQPTGGGDAKRLLARGSYIYVLTEKGVERFDSLTLQPDARFVLAIGGEPLDFALDDEGIYWLSGGLQESELGFLALPLENP